MILLMHPPHWAWNKGYDRHTATYVSFRDLHLGIDSEGRLRIKCLYQVRVIAVFPVFRLLTDFVCLLIYEFLFSLWKIARCSVILLLPLFTTKKIISIYQLLTFHLYVATFQLHRHMEYISLHWSDIPDIVVHIIISMIEGCC